MKNQEINSNSIYFLVKPRKNKDDLYLNNNTNKPRIVIDSFCSFLEKNSMDKLPNFKIIEMAKKQGLIIDYNFSHYKTHTSLKFNNQIYICEQNEYTIAYFIKVLYFLEILK